MPMMWRRGDTGRLGAARKEGAGEGGTGSMPTWHRELSQWMVLPRSWKFRYQILFVLKTYCHALGSELETFLCGNLLGFPTAFL